MKPLVSYDLETTGLDKNKDQIIQFIGEGQVDENLSDEYQVNCKTAVAFGQLVLSNYTVNRASHKEPPFLFNVGYYDDDGYLFISGRKKNVIVLKNGKNVFPEEIEILISKLPYVSENMVYSRPKNDDIIVAVEIVYNKDIMKEMFPNASEEEYHDIIWKDIKEINKTMPKYKYIKHLIVTDEPMIQTTTQKVKRHEEIKKILSEEN